MNTHQRLLIGVGALVVVVEGAHYLTSHRTPVAAPVDETPPNVPGGTTGGGGLGGTVLGIAVPPISSNQVPIRRDSVIIRSGTTSQGVVKTVGGGVPHTYTTDSDYDTGIEHGTSTGGRPIT